MAHRSYISIGEAADYLSVTERTIREMIRDGRLTGYRLNKGGSKRYFIRLDRNEIDAKMVAFGGSVSS